MPFQKIIFSLLTSSLLLAGCGRKLEISPTKKENLASFPIEYAESIKLVRSNYERTRNGKIKNAKELSGLFVESNLDTLDFPILNGELLGALDQQLKLLRLKKNKKDQNISGLTIRATDLEETIKIIKQKSKSGLTNYDDDLSAFQIWGDDRRGHVEFTGYYTPILDVKKNPDKQYKYPLYKYPKGWEGRLPTRRDIDGNGVLNGMNLEIAYAMSLVDIYYMQVQGSGYVNFQDTGLKKLLSFGGKNGHTYSDIETFIQKNVGLGTKNVTPNGIKKYLRENPGRAEWVLFYNPSYVFFNPTTSIVKGSGGVELTEEISVATDPRYLPLGSVILALMPIYDNRLKLEGHEFKILLPQDVGGAIRGSGHVDIYSGIGNQGKTKALARNHYGQLWILLPKKAMNLVLLN